jgi:uncharacterized protein YabE (DUF348 family)/3D (Asp-Asp-Asp) domain-containing protein
MDATTVATTHAIPRLPRGLSGLVTLALVGGALAVGYRATLTPVTLVIDGQARDLHTHQESVGALLLDAGLLVYPEDVVSPAAHTPVEPDLVVQVRRARAVLVSADGETRLLRTHATSVDGLLAEAGVAIGSYDETVLDGALVPSDPDEPTPAHVEVRRAVSLTLRENGHTRTFYTTAPTVGEALYRAGVELYLADEVLPGSNERVTEGLHVTIDRSVPVTVHVDGQALRTRTHRERVDEVLADLSVVLAGQDYTVPALDAPLGESATIHVVRVGEGILIEQESIPYQTIWQPDPELEIDNQRLLQDGSPGILERRTQVRYEDGRMVERTDEREYVLVPPTTRINGFGTKIVIRTLDTPEGPIEYWRVIRHVLATSYSAETAGTPKDVPWYGITRLGEKMRHGIVAVDPNVINLRTRLYVEGYGIGYAGDTGNMIKGRHVDLGYDNDNLIWWRSYVDVYLLPPIPDEVIYVIDR